MINDKNIYNSVKKSINDLKNIKTIYKQIPNLLTLSRAIAPFIIIPLVLTGNMIPAIIVTSAFASTDFLDGLIARKFKVTSELGRELDGVCDKVFAIGLCIPLVITNPVYIINIILEGIIGFSNLKARINGEKPKTIFTGKIKTFFLSFNILIGYLSMFLNVNPSILVTFFSSTCFIQVLTATKYIIKNNKKKTITKSNEYDNQIDTDVELINTETINYEKTIDNDISIDIPKKLVYKKNMKH